MSFRYNLIQKWTKKVYRKFNPIPGSPWTKGAVKDICAINLVPPDTLKIFFRDCIKRLEKLKGGDIGDYLEFGVFNGSSIGSAYMTAKDMNQSINFFGFDSFDGLPDGTDEEHDILQKGFYRCPFEKTKECLGRRGVNPDDITWVMGVYSESLTDEAIETHGIGNIGIVFVDCDTYSSSKEVLNFLAPLITSPAIICFDDWRLYDMDIKGTGEYRSFNEFMEKYTHIKAKRIRSYNRKSESFLLLPEVTPSH